MPPRIRGLVKAKARRLPRWLFRVTLLVGLVAAAGWWWANRYARQQIVLELSQAAGAPVQVDQVRVGFRWHGAFGVRVRAGADPNEWLAVEAVHLELPLGEAIAGRRKPRQVLLDKVVVRLDFDDQGRLVTPLPSGPQGTLPCDRIDVRSAQLTIDQVGRRPVHLQTAALLVRQQASSVTLSCQRLQALGADWSLNGELDSATGASWIEFATEACRVDTASLAELPLIPLARAPLAGSATVSLQARVTRQRAPDSPSYDFRIGLQQGELQLPAPLPPLSDVAGTVRWRNERAELALTEGRVGDARLVLQSSLDCRQWPLRGQVRGDFRQVPLELAQAWTDLSDDWHGKASGHGEFEVELSPASLQVTGQLVGNVQDAVAWSQRLDPIPFEVDLRFDNSPTSQDTLAGELRADLSVTDFDLGRLFEGPFPGDNAQDGTPLELSRRWARWIAGQELGQVSGQVSGKGRLEIPLGGKVGWRDVQCVGQVSSRQLTLAGDDLGPARCRFTLRGGDLIVDDAELSWGEAGRVRGRLMAGFAPAREIQLEAEFEQLDAGRWLPDLPPELVPLVARLSGQVSTLAPLTQIQDVKTWSSCGMLTLSDQTTVPFELDAGQLIVRGVETRLQGQAIRADARVDLSDRRQFQLAAGLPDIDLATALAGRKLELDVPLRGTAQLEGQIHGTWEPLQWSGSGRGTADLLISDQLPPAAAKFAWQLDAKTLTLADAVVTWSEGTIQFHGNLPLETVGSGRIEGRFDGIRIGPLATQFPELKIGGSGTASGAFQLATRDRSTLATAEVTFRGPAVAMAGLELDQLQGQARFEDQAWRLRATGRALMGVLSWNGQLPPRATTTAFPPLSGNLRIEGAELDRLPKQWTERFSLPPLRGRVDAEIKLQAVQDEATPIATGQITVRDFVVGRDRFADELSARVRLTSSSLRLDEIRGRVADGELSGEILVPLSSNLEPEFNLDLRGISLRRVATGSPTWRGHLDGRCDLSVQGRAGTLWRGRGQLRLAQGYVSKIRVSRLRAPFQWTLDPRGGRVAGRVNLRQMEVSDGSVNGSADFAWDGRLSVKGRSRFDSINVAPIARSVPDFSDALGGRLSGEVTFAGKQIRSIDDMTGSFQLVLQQSQALLLPTLDVLTTSLGLTSPAGATFSETKAQGRLQRGVARIDEMTMVSPDYRLWLEGVVRTQGSLDVDVTADVNGLTAVGVVAGVLRPIDLLRRRLIFLNVGGRIDSPIVQPRLDRFLEQECILFFLPVLSVPAS